jgi:hypothetical protein
VLVLFVTGIIAAAFSSADSALAALTTSFSVDILNVGHKDKIKAQRIRKWIHIGISLLFILIIIVFKAINNKSVIDTIYIMVSYTYGPLPDFTDSTFHTAENKRQSDSLYSCALACHFRHTRLQRQDILGLCFRI